MCVSETIGSPFYVFIMTDKVRLGGIHKWGGRCSDSQLVRDLLSFNL